MEFEKKDFEQLLLSKVRDCMLKDTICSKYFFCYDDKIIFINKSKGFYKILASSQCGFKILYHESVFDVIYFSKNLADCIGSFELFVELVCRRF